MSKKELQNKLKNDPRFNPYSQKYDFNYVLDFVRRSNVSNEDSYMQHNVLSSIFFNQYYKDLNKYFTEIIRINKLSKNTFLEIIVTLANRDVYLMLNRTMNSYDSKNEFIYDEIINSVFQSSIPELGLFNAQAGLEASHEGLNTIINLSYQKENNSENSVFKIDEIDNCVKILGFSNICATIKASYNIAIWEDYSIIYYKDYNLIKIKSRNNKNQILNKIGEYRLQRNVFNYKMAIVQAYNEQSPFYKRMSSEVVKNKKPKRLKSIKIVHNNEIKYILTDGFEKEAVLQELLSLAAITSYYSFIGNEHLPNLSDVNLHDILSVFSEIQFLFSQAFEIKKEETDSDLKSFNLYRFKIKKDNLINYIFVKTKYSKEHIKQIIAIFIHEDGYINIWEKPLLQINDYIFPIILPLTSPNQLRMTDYWLEIGGFDLDKRGKLFEVYLKNVILDALKVKGYQVFIPENTVFKNNKGEFEEIDLIVELKNITLVAEIKCIKYPFDPRDYHNMHKRLTQGANQINRKISFIKTNFQDFKSIPFLTKPLVKVVITNYAIFSGFIINDVPITDASLIDNYFINGGLNKGQMSEKDKSIENDKISHLAFQYYTNEDELSDNLDGFFKNPMPISEKVDDVYVEEKQISLPSAKPKILMDYFNFKQSNKI